MKIFTQKKTNCGNSRDNDNEDDNLGVAGKVGGNQRVQHPHSRTSFCISANFFLPNNFPQIAFNLITPFQPQQSLECKSEKPWIKEKDNSDELIRRGGLELKVPVLYLEKQSILGKFNSTKSKWNGYSPAL